MKTLLTNKNGFLKLTGILLIIATTCLLCFESCLAQTKDYWFKIERKGTGYGYEHITISKLENGYLKYTLEQHIKTDVAGFNPQDIVLKGTYIVDTDFLPVSFNQYFKSQIKNIHISGRYTDSLMQLTVEDEEGEVRESMMPFQDTYFDVVLADLILKMEDEKIFNLRIFSPTDLKIDSIYVEVTRSDTKELEATVTDILTMKYLIDRQGWVKQIQFVELNIREYLTDSEDAQDITYLNTADGLTLTVKNKRSFPNVYKVNEAQIQLKWRDIPFDEFNLEDNRQKVMKKTLTKDNYEVILEIKKATPASKGITVPIVDEKFAPFLKNTEYIQPGEFTIHQKMIEIQKNERDAFILVQNILSWISDNITVDIIAETLTGPEVLKERRGKCSEYAILFASLARAAGIPVKVVLGQVISGNLWIGHMWNEVWLGEWMAVDPTAGIFVSGPSHVKLVDSHIVMGTQRVRMKLVDNLSIEILDYKEKETEIITEIKTGIFDNTYYNKAFACKISTPDTTWILDETADAGHTSITLKPQNTDSVTSALVLFAVPPGMSAKAILDGRLNALAGMFKNFRKIEEGEIEIAGHKIPRVVYQADYQQDTNDQLTLISENCLLVEGANGYLFKFTGPAAYFKDFRGCFWKILESFEIVK